ncbi:7375_t:CDS:1, partial [Cetraspora pellucida]
DLKKLVEYDMTDSIKEHMSTILEVINKKFRAIRNAESKKKNAANKKHKEIEGVETQEILVVKNGVVKTKKPKKTHEVEEKVTDESSSEDEIVESSPN